MSNKISLHDFFIELETLAYCIIKVPPNFPDYIRGDDIDILCYDINKISECIINTATKYIGGDLTLKSSIIRNGEKIHIDIMDKNSIEFRFDLYSILPNYHKVNIRPSFFSHVIENRQQKNQTCDGKNYIIYIPSIQDELIIRYLEYIEYFQDIPDKIKHADYILEHLKKAPSDMSFIDTLHHYISVPTIDVEKNRMSIENTNIKYYLKIPGFISIYKARKPSHIIRIKLFGFIFFTFPIQ